MKRSRFLAVLAAALLTGGLAQAARPDAWITAKVKSRLAAAKDVSAFRTNVDTKDGVVTLRGEVRTEAEKALAERHAEGVEGVRRVENRLVVRGEEPSGEGVGGEATERGAAVDQPGLGDRALAGIDDAAITARVKSALAGNKATKARDINVDTSNGEVLLRGTVRSESERTLAEDIAKSVNGVRSVDNQLKTP